MKILQVITDTDRRGAQVFATDLQAGLERRGQAVETVALAPGGSPVRLDLEVLGPSRLAPSTLTELRRRIRAADVVVAHGSTTLPACALAGVGTATPFVYRQISDSLYWAPTRLRRARVRAGLARAARVVALSAEAGSVLCDRFGVASDRIDVIPNGVPRRDHRAATPQQKRSARAHFGLEAERPTVAVLSALVPEKGVDLAIAAVGRLPRAQLLVAGDGPERGALEQQAQQQAPGRVRFAGSLPDPALAYDAADLILLASRGGDSMPAVLIEAGFRRLPAVATDVGAIAEVIEQGATGLVVPEAAVLPISEAIGSLLDDPETAQAMGAEAETRCGARFEIDVVAEAWLATLQSTVQNRQGRRRPRSR